MRKKVNSMWQYPGQLLGKIEAVKPFTEQEAWFLFRTAALAEAIGWTLLLSGILIRHLDSEAGRIAVAVAGRIHGIFFVAYFMVALAAYSSLRWNRIKFLIAIGAGVPPFGTFVFEQWAARTRRNTFSRQHYHNTVLQLLASRV
jgi:integral membrane protein